MFTPSYYFQHVFWWDIWGPLCSNFIMFLPKDEHLVYNSISLSNLLIIFSKKIHNTSNAIWITHFSIASILWCVCTHPINPMGIHLLFCIHNNEHTKTHDTIHDTFVTIARNVSFHMGWEQQLHSFFSITFNPFHWQIYIVLIKDDIHTLQLTLSLLTQHEWIYLSNLVQLKDLASLMWLNLKKRAITTNIPLINSFF
jgi:hypothetical protein